MSDLTDLESRISAALDRVARASERLVATAPESDIDPDMVARLKEALEAEKTANAQLEERVRAIRERQDAQVEAVGERAGQAEAEIARLRHVIENLRKNNQALRDAAADGMVDPSLINSALLSELEALRALRESDRAELDGIIAELSPIAQEAANA